MAIVTKILVLIYFIALKLHIQVPWISSTSILFCFLYFIFIDNKTKYISKILFSVLWLNIALMNGERTQVLVSMLGLIIYIFINKFKNHKKIYALFFIVVSSLLVLIPIIYTVLSLSEYRWSLDSMAIQFTGSRFFSGRDTVWAVLLNNYLENDIYFGAGHHLTPKLISSIEYSAHNTYIIILVRTGLIGLILFFNFLKQIWMSYFKNLNNKYTRLSATYFLTILLKQSSEMGLIGNNMALSVISWIIICFGFFYTNSDSYLK